MLGYGVQQILACILQHYMHLQLPTPGWQPLAISLFTAVLVVMGAATPALFSLARITPLQILRQQSISRQNFSWLNNFSKPLSYKLPALLRLSLANILTNARNNLIQVLAFATVIAVALLLLIIRNDLLVTWQAQQTTNTPNYYVVNIAPENVASMQNILADNAIQTSEFYPLVRGLLIKINQQPVSMGPEENGKRTGIHRPLNLTWTARLPVDNKIRQGAWFSAADIGKPVLSIESSIAERLQVKLGDELTFMINMREINAKITSIRAVRWGDFKPNFYVIYPAGVIDNFPVTYMASFYVPEAKLKTMLALSRRFPEINLLNVTNMLNQAETILMLASFVIGYIWFFTLMISILLLLAVVLTSISMRNYQNNLMRILGASKAQILKVLGIEYFTLGCISGLAGAGLAIGLGKYVAKRFFQTSYPINWSVLVFGCLAGGLIMLCGGILGTRKSLSIAPIQLSRNLN
jgi:putative ABC transport system permease protein